MADPVRGVRRPDGTDADDLQPGEYAKDAHGIWIVRPPHNAQGQSFTGSLRLHTIEEHDDGSITVMPSILQTYGDHEQVWHGFLQQGVWTAL